MKMVTYNYEQYSVFDIAEYLDSKGYDTEFKPVDHFLPSLCVARTAVSVDLPELSKSKDGIKRLIVLPQIRFNDRKYMEIVGNKDSPRVIIADDKRYAQDIKLYETLQRKYRMGKKSGLYPQVIKDSDKIQKMTRMGRMRTKFAQLRYQLLRKIFGERLLMKLRWRGRLKEIPFNE